MSSRLFDLGSLSSAPHWLTPGARELVCHAADALPPIPGYLLELESHLSRVPIDLEAVSEIVNEQKFLRWHLLRVCNVDESEQAKLSVEHAVLLLGAERLRQLAVACALIEPASGEQGSKRFGLAAQAGLRAMVSQQIAVDLRFDDAELAYIAALLKDIGRPAADRFTAEKAPLIGELGAWMAALWNVPSQVVEVIQQTGSHHKPSSMLGEIVHWADAVTNACTGTPGSQIEMPARTVLQDSLKLHLLDASQTQCSFIAEMIWAKFADLLSTMGEVH